MSSPKSICQPASLQACQLQPNPSSGAATMTSLSGTIGLLLPADPAPNRARERYCNNLKFKSVETCRDSTYD